MIPYSILIQTHKEQSVHSASDPPHHRFLKSNNIVNALDSAVNVELRDDDDATFTCIISGDSTAPLLRREIS